MMEEKEHSPLLPWLTGLATLLLAVVVVALFMSDRRPEPSRAYRFDVGEFQQQSQAAGNYEELETIDLPLSRPSALALGEDQTYFIGAENKIGQLDSKGSLQQEYTVEGIVRCLVFDGEERLYAGVNDHVEIRDLQGELVERWEPVSANSWLTSLLLHEDNLYVADAGQRCVFRYDLAGTLLQKIGEKDEGAGIPGIVVPTPYLDIAMDPLGDFWTANPGRHGLESYRPNGELITSWYRPSMDVQGFCGCSNPAHIAFLEDGSLVTAEHGLSRVKIYTPDRQLSTLVAGPESFGEGPTKMLGLDQEATIRDLAVDDEGRILVLDRKKEALRIFQKKKDGQ